jgi:hypothetical protein
VRMIQLVVVVDKALQLCMSLFLRGFGHTVFYHKTARDCTVETDFRLKSGLNLIRCLADSERPYD